MSIKSLLSGAAIAFAMTGTVMAPATAQGLPGVFGGRQQQAAPTQAPVMRVQDNQAAEQQVRELNGRIEELNFQLMQLQEQLRKMQEDTEFRFQQLEGGKSGGGGGAAAEEPKKEGRAAPAEQPTQDTASATTAPAQTDAGANPSSAPTEPGTGNPPRELGEITFDQSGNVVGGSVGDTTTVAPDPQAAANQSDLGKSDDTIVAALPPVNDPAKLYDTSYKSLMSGDYRTAEAGFRKLNQDFPSDARAADTQYWLGESLLGQQKFAAAVDVFAAGAKKYPEAKRAPEMMFKLGVSLASMNRRDVACAAFKAVGERYASASPKLLERAKAKSAENQC